MLYLYPGAKTTTEEINLIKQLGYEEKLDSDMHTVYERDNEEELTDREIASIPNSFFATMHCIHPDKQMEEMRRRWGNHK